jgi:hypothetical protein
VGFCAALWELGDALGGPLFITTRLAALESPSRVGCTTLTFRDRSATDVPGLLRRNVD